MANRRKKNARSIAASIDELMQKLENPLHASEPMPVDDFPELKVWAKSCEKPDLVSSDKKGHIFVQHSFTLWHSIDGRVEQVQHGQVEVDPLDGKAARPTVAAARFQTDLVLASQEKPAWKDSVWVQGFKDTRLLYGVWLHSIAESTEAGEFIMTFYFQSFKVLEQACLLIRDLRYVPSVSCTSDRERTYEVHGVIFLPKPKPSNVQSFSA